MTTSMSAFGKASAAGSLQLRLTKQHVHTKQKCLSGGQCYYSTSPAPVPASNGSTNPQPKQTDPATQRELFMNVLTANATKRDAKQYLARFKPPTAKGKDHSAKLSPLQLERNARHKRDQDRLDRIGVNLGGLYTPARAIAESPVFSQPGVGDESAVPSQQELHVALVCLRSPETLDDATLDGVAVTLSQLVKLDMRILLVLDCGSPAQSRGEGGVPPTGLKGILAITAEQTRRLDAALGKHSVEGARSVPGALEASDAAPGAIVSIPDLLLRPLKRSVIPIVPTLAYTRSGQLTRIPTASVMAALSSLFSSRPAPGAFQEPGLKSVVTSLDRIIVLDTVGGIPSKARGDGAHVFINLEQEFNDIEAELADYGRAVVKDTHATAVPDTYEQHRSNLSMVQACLAMLPSASSALIITPQEAASSSKVTQDVTIGAGTRRQKNTLIHNLLTNKPLVSSSLPVARLPSSDTPNAPQLDIPRATLVKRGMPLTIIPAAPRSTGWLPPETGATTLDLATDPRVDLPRLVHLIENSFRRKLNVQHYLSRIRNRTAGLIIAGEYEGGAILTWETPPGAPANDPSRLVPYLDKFAVLSSSQGSSGVADIVFQAMVRTCFPNGVCWRSRKDNPVNKWYFERSEGTWQVPGSNWTMFWTGEGVVGGTEQGDGKGRWEDYVGVCRSVGPSWADDTGVVD